MLPKRIVLSANSSWNIVNFRSGLVRRLVDRKYEVFVLAPRDEASSLLAGLGAQYVPIEMNPRSIAPLNDLGLIARYRREMKRIAPGVFLGFTPKPNAFGSLAARMLAIPVINTMTGMAFVERPGLARALPMMMLKKAFTRSRIVFFQNEDDKRLFLEEGITRPDQARLIGGSGIDLVRFAPRPGPETDAGLRLLLIGRVLQEKGVLEYVEAARSLRRALPDVRFQLAGPTDVASPSALNQEQVSAWAAEGLIEYLGATEDVRSLIADAHCVVLPSYREGLPRTLLEGAAMAKPLIATDVPGCRSVVTDGVTGFLCAPRSGPSLADSIAKFARLSSAERHSMGQAARRKVEAEFSVEAVIDAYISGIEEILGT